MFTKKIKQNKSGLKLGSPNFDVLEEMDLSKGVIGHLENSKQDRDSLLNCDLKARILKLRK